MSGLLARVRSALSGSLPAFSGCLFVPHNAYHAREMASVADHLRDSEVLFVDLKGSYADEGSHREIRTRGLPCVRYQPDLLERLSPRVLFVMNDWGGPPADLVCRAAELSIPSVALVEGVQDFSDSYVDHTGTGVRRHPYTHCDRVLLVGEYDRQFFKGRDAVVTGSPRFEALLQRPQRPDRSPIAVINSNFTYSIYAGARDQFLETAVEGCHLAGLRPVVSRHHADDGDFFGYEVSDRPLYDLLEESSVLISRFSGAILEALAIGTPVVYHNPHGETVDTFQDPMGAYEISRDGPELAAALKRARAIPIEAWRSQSQRFFRFHVSIDRERSSAERIAGAIRDLIQP